MESFYLYILLCSDKSYYTGITNNLERRIEEHKSGLNLSCYTFSKRPLELAFFEKFNNPTLAINFEKKIKGWSKRKKIALINEKWDLLKKFSICGNQTHYTNVSK